MFESNSDVDLEDDEFLYGVFGDEQENVNFDAKLEDINIGKEQNRTHQEQSHRISLPKQNDTVQNLNRHRSATNNTLTIPYLKLNAIGSDGPNSHSDGILKANENKRKLFDPSPLPKRNKRERKFPGPAGLLPDLKSRRFSNILDSATEDEELNSSTMEDLCSQGRCSGSVLEDEPWQSLLADLGPQRSMLDLVNVASVKRKAAARCFVGSKLPFLAAVLHHIDVSSPDPCVILRDSTGEIHGTLHREVWEQYRGELIVGSVIVIRNAGLLSTGVSCRRHYLNITANNVVTIYSASPKNFQNTRHQRLTPEDLSQCVDNWRQLVPCAPEIGTPSPAASPRLFNSSLDSTSATPRTTNVNRTKQSFAVAHRPTSESTSRLHPVRATSDKSFTPEVARNAPIRQPGRNLIRSYAPSPSGKCPNQTQGRSILYENSKPSTSSFNSPTNFNHRTLSHSNSTNSAVKVNQNPVASNSFKFDPPVLKPNTFTSHIFSQSCTENENVDVMCSQSSVVVNNNKLVLSQSSQLTWEEQSMVEDVFDGLDADSLFDDDF